MRFNKHVFICTNQRPPDSEKKSCGEEIGLLLVKLFKQAIRKKGIDVNIRAQKCGCLDACNYGPSIVVYPEGIYYKEVTPEVVDEIVEQHLINGNPVKRLINNNLP